MQSLRPIYLQQHPQYIPRINQLLLSPKTFSFPSHLLLYLPNYKLHSKIIILMQDCLCYYYRELNIDIMNDVKATLCKFQLRSFE